MVGLASPYTKVDIGWGFGKQPKMLQRSLGTTRMSHHNAPKCRQNAVATPRNGIPVPAERTEMQAKRVGNT